MKAEFHAGHDQNNTALLVNDFHEGRSLPARMVHGGAIVAEATTPLGGALLLIALAASLNAAGRSTRRAASSSHDLFFV